MEGTWRYCIWRWCTLALVSCYFLLLVCLFLVCTKYIQILWHTMTQMMKSTTAPQSVAQRKLATAIRSRGDQPQWRRHIHICLPDDTCHKFTDLDFFSSFMQLPHFCNEKAHQDPGTSNSESRFRVPAKRRCSHRLCTAICLCLAGSSYTGLSSSGF